MKTNSSVRKKLIKDSISIETERQSNSVQDEQLSSKAKYSKAMGGMSSLNMMPPKKISI